MLATITGSTPSDASRHSSGRFRAKNRSIPIMPEETGGISRERRERGSERCGEGAEGARRGWARKGGQERPERSRPPSSRHKFVRHSAGNTTKVCRLRSLGVKG